MHKLHLPPETAPGVRKAVTTVPQKSKASFLMGRELSPTNEELNIQLLLSPVVSPPLGRFDNGTLP